ncbi:MAG: type II toxin-antitoxin system RelE/ParE family toxin [Firmicutes bacterium]|nr:type II toxin-antitoxin system RelE/ParE family toxin [Bacillota bacterium]
MKRYRVLMAEPAAEDLFKIAEYIAWELRDPAAAQKLVGKIKEAVMSLAELPIRYATVADEHLATRGIRKLPIGNYIVFYVVSENDGTVTVVRILYGRRDWEHLL